MNKQFLVLALIVLAFMTCSQAIEQTFEKLIWAKQGVMFGDKTIQTTAASGSGVVAWAAITGKPTFATVATTGSYLSLLNIPSGFPPLAHTHAYAEITNKPAGVYFVDAIASAPYIVIPKLTTVQVAALTPQPGMFIYDVTLNVLKVYNGTVWQILITNQ